jgi:hypothetical protein
VVADDAWSTRTAPTLPARTTVSASRSATPTVASPRADPVGAARDTAGLVPASDKNVRVEHGRAHRIEVGRVGSDRVGRLRSEKPVRFGC